MPASYASFNGDISALANDVLVINMEKGEKVTKGGLIVIDDNGKDRGIRNRWCQVYKIGSKLAATAEFSEGDWILVEHGRWTYGFDITTNEGETLYVQKVEVKSILAASDECPLS